jgi:hypothetical protein
MVEEHLELLSLADTHLGYEALATIIFKLKNLVSLPKVSGSHEEPAWKILLMFVL